MEIENIEYKINNNNDYICIKKQLEKELQNNKMSVGDIDDKFSNEIKLLTNEFNAVGRLSDNNVKKFKNMLKILNLYKELNTKEIEIITNEISEFKKINKQLEERGVASRSLALNNEQLQLKIKDIVQKEIALKEKINSNNSNLKENEEILNKQIEQINKSLGNINNKYSDVHVDEISPDANEKKLTEVIKQINGFNTKHESLKNVSNSITRAINSSVDTIKDIIVCENTTSELLNKISNISIAGKNLHDNVERNETQIKNNDEFIKNNQKIDLEEIEKNKIKPTLNNKKNNILIGNIVKITSILDVKNDNVSNILNERFSTNSQKKQDDFTNSNKTKLSKEPLSGSTFGEYEEKKESKFVTEYMKKWYNYLDDLLNKPEEEFIIDKNNITNFKLVFRNSKTGLSTFKESVVQLNHSISSKTSPVFQLGSNVYKAVSQGVRLLAGTIVINAFKNVPFAYLHSISNSENASIEKIPPLDLYIIPIENLSDGRFEALLIKNIKFTDLRQTDGASSGGRYYAANFIAQNFIPVDFSTVSDFSFFEKN